MASKPLTERFQIRIDDLVAGRRYSTRQHAPGGKEDREELDWIDVSATPETLARALERSRTDTVMGDEALQHAGIHPPHRDARLVEPHQDVPAGTPIAHERIGRVAAPRALGQELLEEAQAFVELAWMLETSALLEEPNEPERSGDELPGPTGEHLATLAVAARQRGRLGRDGRAVVATAAAGAPGGFRGRAFSFGSTGALPVRVVFDFLAAQPRLDYVVAMAKNAVLLRHAEPAMLVARARTWRSEQTEYVYTETDEYQAGKWSHARRVIIKAEVVRLGDREPRDNPRFVVTNMQQTPRFLYEKVYCARGDVENRIKELKALHIDRTSCQKFSPNQLRVLLTAAAYVLMQELRLRAAGTAWARTQVPWLRNRLLKLGVQVVHSVRRIVLDPPRATPDIAAWRQIAFALGGRAPDSRSASAASLTDGGCQPPATGEVRPVLPCGAPHHVHSALNHPATRS